MTQGAKPCPTPLFPFHLLDPDDRTTVRWVIPGSRLSTPEAFGGCHLIELLTYKAAPLHNTHLSHHK